MMPSTAIANLKKTCCAVLAVAFSSTQFVSGQTAKTVTCGGFLTADTENSKMVSLIGFGSGGSVFTAMPFQNGGFTSPKVALNYFPAWDMSKHVRVMADVDGDGRADLVGFGDAGVYTALSFGDGSFQTGVVFQALQLGLANFGVNQAWKVAKHVRLLADINGDGKADIVGFGDAGVWTALAIGGGKFAPAKLVLANFGAKQGWDPAVHVRMMADINGDGKADIVAFGYDGVWTAISKGDGTFAPEKLVLAGFGTNQGWTVAKNLRTMIDLNGDHKADIVGFGNDGVYTALSTGDGGFGPAKLVVAGFGVNQGWDAPSNLRVVANLGNALASSIALVGFGYDGVWTSMPAPGGMYAPPKLVLAKFGASQGWDTSKGLRTIGATSLDGRGDVVAVDGVTAWTAFSNGEGGFYPPVSTSMKLACPGDPIK